MSFEHYIRSGTKQLRCGITTGSCAALAASGAAQMLLCGGVPEKLSLLTPGRLRVEIKPEYCCPEKNGAVCAVRKDAGDDPDVTDGILIIARVKRSEAGIDIDGGPGVGRVTKPGLDQPVGSAAINTVPRRMIREALETVCKEADYSGGLHVEISAENGEEIAGKTFNPLLGIEGGISILGTSGLVEPMSEQAIVDTIALEIRQKKAEGSSRLILCPGNYGLDYVEGTFPELGSVPRVKYSNYIGEALDLAVVEGMKEVLLVGHIGKLVKLAGGIMNTHSRIADCRKEIFCAYAALCGAGLETCENLMRQVTADACLDVLETAELRSQVTEHLLYEIQRVLDRRVAGACGIGAVLFSNVYGMLGCSSGAETMLNRWKNRL